MKPLRLIIAVLVLAALGGVTWWSNKKQAADASKPAADAPPMILTTPADQFQEVRITRAVGDGVDLVRANGSWRITGTKPLAADPAAVDGVTSVLSNMGADRVIEDKAADLAQYGLASPAMTIAMVKKNGKTESLLVGSETPTGSGYYAMRASDAKVFTIFTSVKSAIDKTANDLRDKRLLTFNSEKLTRIGLEAKGASIEFGKNNQNDWQILKPRPLRADGMQVDELIRHLREAKMDLSEGEDQSAAFASGALVAKATVTDAAGSQTIEVRKAKGKDKKYFARSSVLPGAYRAEADLGDGLDKGLEDFRNKKLFDFAFNDPDKVELKDAAYAKAGDKWISGSKPMDGVSVQNLIDKLRDLAATKFPESGAGEPVFEVTVTSMAGKRVEKITITRQGDRYFAKREGEPSIYELDSAAVDGLKKAAADVKQAPPEQPKKK